MKRNSAIGVAAVAGTAVVGTAVGMIATRRASRGLEHVRDPEWVELHRALGGQSLQIPTADATVLHAETLGPADAPVIVLSHGFAMAKAAWHYQRRDLANEFRVVAYDQRGHGASAPAASGDYSIEVLGTDLAAVLDAVLEPGQRAVVAGHSMGGMSILSFAEQLPQRLQEQVAGVVLLDTTATDLVAGSAFSAGSALAAKLLGKVAARLVTLRPPPRVQFSDLSMLITREVGLSSSASAAHVAFTQELALNCPSEVSAALIPAMEALDVREAARNVGIPCMVVVGEEDRLTPPAAAKELVQLLRQGELVILPGVGHMSPFEAHREVTAHLRAFARKCLSQAAA